MYLKNNTKINLIRISIFFIFLIIPTIGQGQISTLKRDSIEFKNEIKPEKRAKISTRIGLSTFSNFTLQYERIQRKNIGISFELGLNYATNILGNGSGLFCWSEAIQLVTDKKGIIVRSGIVFNSSNNMSKFNWSIQGDFRKLKADNIIVDEGCFTGSDGKYSKFNWKGTEVGLILHLNLGASNKRVIFYISYGYSHVFQIKEYEIDGTFGSQIPSDKIEKSRKNILRFDFGMKYRLKKFQKGTI